MRKHRYILVMRQAFTYNGCLCQRREVCIGGKRDVRCLTRQSFEVIKTSLGSNIMLCELWICRRGDPGYVDNALHEQYGHDSSTADIPMLTGAINLRLINACMHHQLRPRMELRGRAR